MIVPKEAKIIVQMPHISVMACWIMCCSFFVFDVSDASRPVDGDHALLDKLFSDYGSTYGRPVAKSNQSLEVQMFMVLQQVIELNEREQTLKSDLFLTFTWADHYLSWNTSDFQTMYYITIPCSEIWLPSIYLFETVQKDFTLRNDIGCTVTPDGIVTWATPKVVSTSCRIDARKFPFDTQYCELRFAIWFDSVEKVNLTTDPLYLELPKEDYFIENGVWGLQDVSVTVDLIEEDGWNYSQVRFAVDLKRRSLFHVLSFVLPCILLSGLNILVFMLPIDSGEKVSLGITNLLALVLFQQLIADTLPPASSNLPVIMYFSTPTIFIGGLSILTAVLVAQLHHHGGSRPVPRWLRRLTQIDTKCSSVTPDVDASTHGTAPDEKKIPENDAQLFSARKTSAISYPIGQSKVAPCPQKEEGSSVDYSNEWKKCAVAIDKMFLKVACAATIMAMLLTIILFATA